MSDRDLNARLVARYGQVVSAKQLEGVHLGTKVGRSPGVRLGYSQIANPVYLMRKRTMSVRHASIQIGRNLIANLVKAWRPKPGAQGGERHVDHGPRPQARRAPD